MWSQVSFRSSTALGDTLTGGSPHADQFDQTGSAPPGQRPVALLRRNRSLRADSKPQTTRCNCELAVAQFADSLAGDGLPRFIAWMIQTRSSGTALNKYKALQQFFNHLLDSEEMERHPMANLSQPKTTERIIPVVDDDQLATFSGKSPATAATPPSSACSSTPERAGPRSRT